MADIELLEKYHRLQEDYADLKEDYDKLSEMFNEQLKLSEELLKELKANRSNACEGHAFNGKVGNVKVGITPGKGFGIKF